MGENAQTGHRELHNRAHWAGPVAHILSGSSVARTVACPVPEQARTRVRRARAGTAEPPRLPEPVVVRRRVSVRGAIMIGGQRIQVGLTPCR
jgi:hypothetical protein